MTRGTGVDAQQISIPALMKWGGTFIAAQWLRVPTGMQALVIFMAKP